MVLATKLRKVISSLFLLLLYYTCLKGKLPEPGSFPPNLIFPRDETLHQSPTPVRLYALPPSLPISHLYKQLRAPCTNQWNHSPLSVHCPLSTIHCPLATVHFPLSTYHCPLSTFHCPLSSVHCSVFTVHSPLSTPHSPLSLWTLICPLSTQSSETIPLKG